MNRLQQKVAIITGGGTGIGRAICEEFAKQGAVVVVAGENEENIKEVEQLIRGKGGESLALKVDVSNSREVKQMIELALNKYKQVDILVNCAGIQLYGTSETMHEQDWDRVIDVNLKGVFLCTKYILPIMKTQRRGSIIHISSVTAHTGHPNLIAYTAAKGGIEAMTRATAIEFAKEGIRCNSVAPGTVNTPILQRHLQNHTDDPEMAWKDFQNIHPIGRVAEPREVAQACVYLASDEAAFITGTTIMVDGGYTVQGILP